MSTKTLTRIKNELMVTALPAIEYARVLDHLNAAFPQMYAGTNILETSLSNANAMMHPAPTLLNFIHEIDIDFLSKILDPKSLSSKNNLKEAYYE